jgi:molecular chaperone DnaK (HSP70)
MRIALDIGTYAARVAALDAQGRPFVVPDRYHNVVLPAVVRYTMHGAETGEYAARYQVASWENSVRGPSRFLARYADLPARVLSEAPFGVIDAGGDVLLDLLYAQVTPQQAYSELIAALRRRAEDYFGTPITEAVITVPANAEDRFRVLVRKAAEDQGLRVYRLVNQPTAALIGYQYGDPGQASHSTVAVVDVGGGTTDVSIAELHGGQVRILSTAGDGFLGGQDLAWRVAHGLAERFAPQVGFDLLAATGSRVAALGLFHAAEAALQQLSLLPGTPIAIDHGAGFARDLYTLLRREHVEQWLADDLARLAAVCQRALHLAGKHYSAVDTVLLVGGGSSLPGVPRTVATAFGRMPADLQRRDPLILTVLGAALIANGYGPAIQDVTPYPLGINCYYGEEELLSVIVPANTPIPTPPIGTPGALTERYTTRFPDQQSVRLDVLQYRGTKIPATYGANRVYPHECELLGSWQFEGLRPRRGECAPFTITFALNEDGILELMAEETRTGHTLRGQVRRGVA